MAQTKKKTTTRRTASRGKTGPGHKAFDRLNDSLESAQSALKDLRSEMSRGSRTILKDVDGTLKDARKHARSIRGRVTKDLEELQKAASGKKTSTARKSTAGKSTARKATASRSTAGRSTARKSTARKSTAGKSTARKSTAGGARKRTTAKKR